MPDPWLTQTRWACLKAFQRQPDLMDRPFQAKELITLNRKGDWVFPCSGATMHSLREAGWIDRVAVETNTSVGFRTGGPTHLWQITDAGRKAVENCPDVFAGEPTYGVRK